VFAATILGAKLHTDLRTTAVLFLASLLGALLPSIASADEPALPLIEGPAYTQPQDMVSVEAGRRLNLYCVGEGSPTVVFESGQGSPLFVWAYVQPMVAKTMRACSYDRAGTGFSEGTKRASTSVNIVDDLHRLLVAADIKPPYVLVGHSLGGLFVRLYADKYPAEVVGMVLVDPAVEDQTEPFRKLDLQHRTVAQWRTDTIEPDIELGRLCVATVRAGLVRDSDMFKKCTTEHWPQLSDAVYAASQANEIKLANQEASLSETENQFSVSADQVRASRHSYGDLPLVVLTRGQWPAPKADATPEELANSEARHQAWTKMHDDVARLSTRGTNEVVAGARHYILFDKPQAVIAAIDKVVREFWESGVAAK
jgi:pimeloyl-ACP methyl ester carboxylesterase